MRILYAEDNEVNQALLERVVRARGCTILFRAEGQETLDTLAADPTIDLLLLDIELADSCSGLDVIKALRARGDCRPVVAITAYAMRGDRERILAAGCDGYLAKPLEIPALLAVLDQYTPKPTESAPAAPATETPHTPAPLAPSPAAPPTLGSTPAAAPISPAPTPAPVTPAPDSPPAALPAAPLAPAPPTPGPSPVQAAPNPTPPPVEKTPPAASAPPAPP